jgi:23S rRNA pseudouridine1911/1915/1917 synthase
MYAGQSCLRKSDLIRLQAEGPDDMVLIDRQALHAFRLTFRHPVSGKEMQFEAPFPEDFDRTLRFLRSL